MKNYIFITLIILLSSCNKIDIEDTIPETSQAILKSATAEVKVLLGTPSNPTMTGEVQIDLLSPATTNTYIHLKIKEGKKKLWNVPTNPLVSPYFMIPAGSRYVICDIDEYTKTVKVDGITVMPLFGEEEGDYSIRAINPVYIQICDVYSSGNDNFIIDNAVLGLSRSFGSISYSWKQSGGFMSISDISCGSPNFYVPGDDGGGPIPVDPPSLPIERPSLPIL